MTHPTAALPALLAAAASPIARAHRPRRWPMLAALAAALAALPACGQSAKAKAANDTAAAASDTAGAIGDTGATDDSAASGGRSGKDGCVPAPVAPGAVRVRLLACADDLPHGTMAAGRVGDLVFENSRVRFVLRKGKLGHAIGGLVGGDVVDAVTLGPDGKQVGVDALREWVPTAALHLVQPDAIEVVADGSAGEARVRVSGPLTPFPTAHAALALDKPKATVSHEYVLRPDSRRLELRTTIVPDDGKQMALMVADASFWGGSLAMYRPGSGDADSGVAAVGSAQVIGFAPADDDATSVAAAIGYEAPVSIIDAGGILAFLQPTKPIPGEGQTFVRWLAVGGDLADAMAEATASAAKPPLLVQLQGKVEGAWPGVEVEALSAKGGPLTRCKPATDGTFACKVPADATHARALWLGNGNGQSGGPGQSDTPKGVPLQPQDGVATLTLQAPKPSLLVVHTKDKADGKGLPFQLLALPKDGGGGFRTFVDADGEATFRLPAGEWQVWIHHGPEFSALETKVTVSPTAPTEVTATLERVLDTTGWIAADMHVHAEHSADSTVPNRQRITDAVAVGLDYVVATDHDFVTDYQPWLVEAGIADRLTVASGVEVSTIQLGHHNVWPLTQQQDLAGNGAIDWYGKDAAALQNALRGNDDKRVVQCNHPRGSQSYFAGIALDPKTTDVALLAFNAMEIINGKRMSDTVKVLQDWFGLIDRGLRITGTGNSDTHSLEGGIGGTRTYIFVGEAGGKPRDVQGAFQGADADAALKAGRAVASTGPLLTLELRNGTAKAGIGDTLTTTAGDVEAVATLQAPAWMPLGSVEIYRNGELVHTEAVTDTAVEAGRRKVNVSFKAPAQAQGWWLALHRPGTAPSTPLMGRPVWAITNPAFEAQAK